MPTDNPRILLVLPVTRNGTRVLRVERCQQKVLSHVGIWPPIHLLEIALYLEYVGFHNIEIIDGEIERLSFKVLRQRIREANADYVIMHSTQPTFCDDNALAQDIKSENPDIKTVVFGVYATTHPERYANTGLYDHVIEGEPAFHIVRIISGSTLQSCLDYPTVPNRKLLKNELYKMPLLNEVFTVIKVSKGCDYACAFCTSRAYYGKGWRARSVDNIIQEIKNCCNEYGIRNFLFLSDTFNMDREWVKTLCDALIREKLCIRWVSNSRADRVDESAAKKMKKAGCVLVSLGIESFDQDVLDSTHKSASVSRVKKGIRMLQEADILTLGYLLLALKKATVVKTIKTLWTAACSDLDFLHVYWLTPYAGTFYESEATELDGEEFYHGYPKAIYFRRHQKILLQVLLPFFFFLFYLNPMRAIRIMRFIQKRKSL